MSSTNEYGDIIHKSIKKNIQDTDELLFSAIIELEENKQHTKKLNELSNKLNNYIEESVSITHDLEKEKLNLSNKYVWYYDEKKEHINQRNL